MLKRIKVPWDTDDIDTSFQKTADNVIFAAAIEKNDCFGFFVGRKFLYLFGGNFGDNVYGVGVVLRDVLGVADLSQHDAFISQMLRQKTGVFNFQRRYFFNFKPI